MTEGIIKCNIIGVPDAKPSMALLFSKEQHRKLFSDFSNQYLLLEVDGELVSVILHNYEAIQEVSFSNHTRWLQVADLEYPVASDVSLHEGRLSLTGKCEVASSDIIGIPGKVSICVYYSIFEQGDLDDYNS